MFLQDLRAHFCWTMFVHEAHYAVFWENLINMQSIYISFVQDFVNYLPSAGAKDIFLLLPVVWLY